MVLQLSEMMRYMLYDCNETKVPLSKEINYLKNYLELERLRQSDDFDILFEINGDHEEFKIAPLVFMPFVENSFKHGMSQQLKNGFIHIEINIIESTLNLKIQNSISEPTEKEGQKNAGGIGLINIKRRLALLYPDNHTLEITETDKKYSVELNLNLI